MIVPFQAADMHVHTCYSHDCNTPLYIIKELARKQNIIVSITDHNRIGGSLAAKSMNIPVIPAIEVTTKNLKDFLVYFYDFDHLVEYYERVVKPALNPGRIFGSRTRLSINDVIEGARDYDSFISLAHPFCAPPKKTGNLPMNIINKLDAIEVMNFGIGPRANHKAAVLCEQTNKVFTAGSDSHHPSTLGKVTVQAHSREPEELLSEVAQGHCLVLGYQRKTKDVVKYVRNYLRTR